MPHPNPDDQLHGLLLRCFNSWELRWFLGSGPHGQDLASTLPEGGVGPAELVGAAILAMRRRNLIGREFFDRLLGARPRLADEIEACRRGWLAPSAEPPSSPAMTIQLRDDGANGSVTIESRALGLEVSAPLVAHGRAEVQLPQGLRVTVHRRLSLLSIEVSAPTLDGFSGLTVRIEGDIPATDIQINPASAPEDWNRGVLGPEGPRGSLLLRHVTRLGALP